MFYEFYFLFFFLLLLAITDIRDSCSKSLAMAVSFFCLSLFAGFRYLVPDYGNYVEIFSLIPENTNTSIEELKQIHGEYGYLLLNFIIKYLGGNFLIVAVIVSTLSVFLNLRVISKLSIFPLLSVIFYFGHLFINKELILLRTGLASSIVLFGIYLFIQRKSYISLLSCIFVAATFHLAALVALLLPIVIRLTISNRMLLLIALFFFVFATFHLYPTGLILSLFGSLGLVPDSLALYINHDVYNYEIGSFNLKTVQQLITAGLLFWFRELLRHKIIGFDVLLSAYILSTIVLLAFGDFAIMGARLATMLANVEVILLPLLILTFKARQRAIPYLVVVVFSLIMMSFNLGVGRLSSYENYLFDLFK